LIHPAVPITQWTGYVYDGIHNFTETRQYNANTQLTRITNSVQDTEYVYSGTQYNGRILQTVNHTSGETVGYSYDTLNPEARDSPVLAEAPHYVTQRGVDRQAIFFSEADHRVYLELIRHSAQQFRMRLLGYCLMSNHVHWVVIPGQPDSLARVDQS
jgi:hypothetical protein